MKIGLVSYHRDPNYGTMLQAYALAAAVRQLGCDCEYIDYIRSDKAPWPFGGVKRFLGKIKSKFTGSNSFDYFATADFQNIMLRFSDFHRTFIPLSKNRYYANTISTANKYYDYFIVGSDQTWSKQMNSQSKAINFLPFVSESSRKRAYAPSIGSTHIDDEFRSFLISQLVSFSSLSCRERSNCYLLSRALGKDVQYVIDPTLLLTSNDWDSISIQPSIKGDYILAYILGRKKCISEFAEMLGRKVGLPVYYILTCPEYLGRERLLEDVGPREFVGLIKNASYVVTDSFHGTAFSINYRKQFYSFAKREAVQSDPVNDNDRIIEFLKEFGLEKNFKADDDLSFSEIVDYDAVCSHLNELRIKSWNYLKSITV